VKVGDLVTLSSYCLQRADMWRWRDMRTFYYVNWMQDGPGSRYGRSHHRTDGYFLRNDLKFVKKGDFK
jgi:hypothetical protein